MGRTWVKATRPVHSITSVSRNISVMSCTCTTLSIMGIGLTIVQQLYSFILIRMYCRNSHLLVKIKFMYWKTSAGPPLPLLCPVPTPLRISMELWVSIWAGHWVVETVLISTSSTSPSMIPNPHMEDFWTSLMPVLHSVNWQGFRQAMSTPSKYMVSTVGLRRGLRVSPWQSLLKVRLHVDQCMYIVYYFNYFSQNYSLVPRLFPPPVFDHLQYANTEGKGLGDLVTCGYVR